MYSPVANNCGDIVDAFEGLLNDEYGLPWRGDAARKYGRQEVRVGPEGEAKHYVFEIDGEFLADYDDGQFITIDLSFDQFCDANHEAGLVPVSYGPALQLADEQIRILPPGDARLAQYMSIKDFYGRL
jgi:hypothetical protein